MKCDELIEKIKQADDDYRHKFIPINLDVEIEDLLGAFAELKDELESRRQAAIDIKLSAEKVLRDLLDCGLIKEWYFNGKFNAVLKADDPHLEIAELKAKLDDVNELIKTARKMLEDAKATHYAEMVDAGMRERRLKRALWLARANRALEKIAWFKLWNASISTMNPEDGARQEFDKWKRNLGKFLKKAEEYK